MSGQIDWEAPALDAFDQLLIEAYNTIGQPLDQLPYTDDFERLYALVASRASNAERHAIYMRLLSLRKRGLLPRMAPSARPPVKNSS